MELELIRPRTDKQAHFRGGSRFRLNFLSEVNWSQDLKYRIALVSWFDGRFGKLLNATTIFKGRQVQKRPVSAVLTGIIECERSSDFEMHEQIDLATR